MRRICLIVTAAVTLLAVTPPAAAHDPDGVPRPQRFIAEPLRDDAPPASARRLELVATIGGAISPKSVVASGDGLFIAQNMMYRHTMTVYDRSYRLVATIPDEIDLQAFGFDGYQGTYRGSPVEAAFTSDGKHVYVSNYQMYGAGFGRPGGDGCGLAGWDESFLYRVDTASLVVDQVIAVGAVPKFLAVTPDDRHVLVSNWCSFDVSVVDVATGAEIVRLPMGRHPRGIAVDRHSAYAYVAVMGSTDIARIRLVDMRVDWLRGIGSGPRHIVLDPAGRYLYVTLNGEGRLAKVDLRSGEVVAKLATGRSPRSMAISDDGTSLYVVNYHSNTMTKVRTTDMKLLQRLPTNHLPIGVTYDPAAREVWVSNYSGTIQVFADRDRAPMVPR